MYNNQQKCQRTPVNKNPSQSILYYSDFCKYCNEFKKLLSNSKYRGVFKEICTDPPIGDSGRRKPLPRFLNKVPTIVINGDVFETDKAFNWLTSSTSSPQEGTGNSSGEIYSYASSNFSNLFSYLPGNDDTNSVGGTSMSENFQPIFKNGQMIQDNTKVKQPLRGSGSYQTNYQNKNYNQETHSKVINNVIPSFDTAPFQSPPSVGQLDDAHETFMKERNMDLTTNKKPLLM